MRRQIDRAEVAHRDLAIRGIQCYLGTQIGAVNHTDVLLWAADIAWILEGHPRMARFK